MRNLKRSVPPAEENAVVPRGTAPDASESFKKAFQLLENAIVQKLAEKPISRGNLLAVLLDEQSALIERLTPTWQRREVLRMVRSIQQRIGSEEAEADQYLLPGFENLPKRIKLAGKKPRIGNATYAMLCEYLEIQERQQLENPRIVALRGMVKLMKKYARQEPEITVREVCERERE